jgi:hypothetical protein
MTSGMCSRSQNVGHGWATKGAGQQQEIDMTTQEREIDLLSDDANQLSIVELDAVSGGRIRWIDIHMPYNDFTKMPVNAPAPTRYA